MKIYNKLVRDKIPEIILEDNKVPIYRTLNTQDYIIELNKKLNEEIQEYNVSNQVEELADICEVIHAILDSRKISVDDFEKIILDKKENRGGFLKRLFLEKVIDNE